LPGIAEKLLKCQWADSAGFTGQKWNFDPSVRPLAIESKI
jgi:hypothetical protein